MKKILKIIAIIMVVALIAIQFVRPNRTNPDFLQSDTLRASTKIPEKVDEVLKRSCNDCHSNETIYPWYSNISPISWKVVEHIEEGREELNFSIWKTYSKDRKVRKLEEICEEVESGGMPHEQYLYIHWDAELTALDKQRLCDWTKEVTKEINVEG